MAKTALRHCCVCKQEYRYCPKCSEHKNLESWHFSFCSENCRNIYEITSKYENGQITDTDIKKQIQTVDLSKIENFGDSYKATIAKINSVVNEKKAVAEIKKVTNTASEKDEEKPDENKVDEKKYDETKSNEISTADNITDEGINRKSKRKRISKDYE